MREWDVNTGQLVRVFSGPRGISWIDDISPEGEQVLIEYDLEYYRTAVQVNQCPENPRKTGVRALRRTHLFFEPL